MRRRWLQGIRSFSSAIKQFVENSNQIGVLSDLQINTESSDEDTLDTRASLEQLFPSFKEKGSRRRFSVPEKPIPFSSLIPSFAECATGRVLTESGVSPACLELMAERNPRAFHLNKFQVLELLQCLEKELQISVSDINSMLLRFPRLLTISVVNIVETFKFLMSRLKATEKETRSILVSNPFIVRAGFDLRFEEGLKMLYDRYKVTAAEVKQLVLRDPQLLEFVEGSRLRSLAAFLEAHLEMSVSQVGILIKECPELLKHTKLGLNERLHFLSHYRIKKSQIRDMLARYPSLLHTRYTSEMRHTVNYLEGALNADKDLVGKIVTREPHVFRMNTETEISPTLATLRNLGFNLQEIGRICVRCPAVLTQDLQSSETRVKIDFLKRELRKKLKDLITYPNYLVFSMEDVIRPRVAFLQSLGRSDYREWPLMKLFGDTDGEFCTRHVKVIPDKYTQFKAKDN